MKRGNTYLITYHNTNKKTILATFLEEINGMYLFKDIHGEFAVSQKKINRGEITLELMGE